MHSIDNFSLDFDYSFSDLISPDRFESIPIENSLQTPSVIKTTASQPIEHLIGTLTKLKRAEKIQKYLQKRKKRIWHKRIEYDCRKKVADKRLRIKGRFVTKEQATLKSEI